MVAPRTLLVFGSIAASAAFLYLCYRSGCRPSLCFRASMDSKPQRNFKIVLADNSTKPFVHLRRPQNTEAVELHPFHYEISTVLENSCRLPTLASTEAGPPAMTEPYFWIETKDQLVKLAKVLSQEYEFAVDTEQHSTRSFLGFTALIQVSTRKQDFLIDTIALHDEMSILQSVFADPSICKVFHGADSDILWLQRDFHIYIVNLFDTARACDILGKPQRSLAYLLQCYCSIVTNKIFQRADWRLRPLPEEMVQYARIDAHYLLYISDCLRNELLQGSQHNPGNGESAGSGFFHGSLFEECVRRSNTICLQLYEKDGASASPATTAASLISRYHSNKKSHRANSDKNSKEDDRFRIIVHSLCEWRDAVARAEDESPRFVLSDQAILALAECVALTNESIFSTIHTADEAFQIFEPSNFMTPLPSPSPIVLKDIKYLRNLFRRLEKETENDLQGSTDPHSDASKNNKASSANKWNFGKSVDSFREIEEQGGDKSSHFGRDTECRVPRRWKVGDVEASRRRFVKKFSCKAPVYHNCRIYAGDGRLLCYCDRKKLDWYVQRGLAEFVDENPPAVRLLFEPKGRPEDENNEFYIQRKTNCCVGCGESSHYLRYRVIPSCYRQHFPEHLKSHRSHDIVLLCVDCHEVAHRAAEMHKRQVAIEYGVPLFAKRVVDSATTGGGQNEAEVLVDEAQGGAPPLQLRVAAMALLRHGSSMPKERREQLEEVVRAYYGGRNITQQDIQAALFAGKAPRELRRLRKKKGLFLENIPRTGDNDLRTEEDMDKAVCQRPDEEKMEVARDLGSLQLKKEQENLVVSDGDEFTGDVSGGDIGKTTHAREVAKNTGFEESNRSSPQDDGFVTDYKQKPYPDDSFPVGSGGSNDEVISAGNLASETNSERPLLCNKPSQRVSLLGHGPHGKRVVEILLEREGEDGIRQFCQRWRAVFVEALKPSFLPSGWAILHSGRREFGEYSVYNPAKKAVQESK